MKQIKRTSLHIDPATGKPVIGKIITTKRGNKKTIYSKTYEIMLVPKVGKKTRKSVNDETKFLKELKRRKYYTFNKAIPTIKPIKKDGIWSDIGKQVLQNYRSERATFLAENTEMYCHPGFEMDNPDKKGYYEVKRRIKPIFRTLPSMKLTAAEKEAALSTHKTLMKMKRLKNKEENKTHNLWINGIDPAFNKEAYSTAREERVRKSLIKPSRFDKLTMFFRDHIPTVIDEVPIIEAEEVKPLTVGGKYKSRPYTVVELKQWNNNTTGYVGERESHIDYEETLDDAVARANKWKENNKRWEKMSPSRYAVYENRGALNRKGDHQPIYCINYDNSITDIRQAA